MTDFPYRSGPKGIHVAHFIIDGAVRAAERPWVEHF
jgi:hypothetical protein